jgi:hypothetical protein
MRTSDFLPLLGIISGIFALFVDAKNQPKWRGVAIAGIVLAALLSVGASLYDDHLESLSHAAEQKQVEIEHDDLHRQLADLRTLVLQQNGVRAPETVAANPADLHRSVEAAQLKQQVMAKLPSASSRTLEIQYFPRFTSDVNPDVVIAALHQLGASVTQKAGTNPAVQSLPTNCVWAGDDVTLDEARSVALALTAAGVKVRDIRQLAQGGGAHSRLIEIGSSARVEAMPVLSPTDIINRGITKRTDPSF